MVTRSPQVPVLLVQRWHFENQHSREISLEANVQQRGLLRKTEQRLAFRKQTIISH